MQGSKSGRRRTRTQEIAFSYYSKCVLGLIRPNPQIQFRHSDYKRFLLLTGSTFHSPALEEAVGNLLQRHHLGSMPYVTCEIPARR
jgi:hypothetical protein